MVSANKLLLLAMALLLAASSAQAQAPAPAPAPGPSSQGGGLCPAGFKNRLEFDAAAKLLLGNLEFIFITTNLTSTIITTKPTNHTVCVCASASAAAVLNPIVASSGNTIICVTLAPAPTTSAPTPSPAPARSAPTPSPSPAPAPARAAPTPGPVAAPGPSQGPCPAGFKSLAEFDAAAKLLQGIVDLTLAADLASSAPKPTHGGSLQCVCAFANVTAASASGNIIVCLELAPAPAPAPKTSSAPTPSPTPTPTPAPARSAPPTPSPAPARPAPPSPSPAPAPVPSSQAVCPADFKTLVEFNEAVKRFKGSIEFSLDGATKPTRAGVTLCVCRSVFTSRKIAVKCTSA